jgi:FMN phosphatase YigB (HAD superfamily)
MRRNILLDFDGTLHDTDSVYASILDGVFDLEGRELYCIFLNSIHRKQIHRHYPNKHNDMNFHWKLLLEYLGKNHNRTNTALLAKLFEKAKKTVENNPHLFPDAQKFLEGLFNAGYNICLSTGGGNSIEKANALTSFLGKNYFVNVYGEEKLGHLKHETNYYIKALKLLKWNSKNTFSIGDTLATDIFPAKHVNIKTVWINRKGEEKPTDPKKKPDITVPDLDMALKKLLLTKQKENNFIIKKKSY